jgi:hypothetical protein
MKISQETLCKFGWHDWNKWSYPSQQEYTDTKKTFFFQERTCKCCEKHVVRSEP